MKNSEQPAFAMLDPNSSYSQYGLTKREYFAAMALSAGSTPKESVWKSDLLLAELEGESRQYRATEMFTMLKRLLSAEMPDELRKDLNDLIGKIGG